MLTLTKQVDECKPLLSGGSAAFERCEFYNHVAEKEGGAVFIDGGAASSFDGCTFRENAVRWCN